MSNVHNERLREYSLLENFHHNCLISSLLCFSLSFYEYSSEEDFTFHFITFL